MNFVKKSKALARTLFLPLLLLVQLKLVQTSREMNNCRVRKASFSTPASASAPASYSTPASNSKLASDSSKEAHRLRFSTRLRFGKLGTSAAVR